MSEVDSNPSQLSLSASAARNLATATVTVPQFRAITPRWVHKLLPWVDVDGGVYRVNRVRQNEEGVEQTVEVLTVDSGEPKLPAIFVDYEENPREYHLSTIQAVVHTHTRVTDLYSNRIDQLRQQVRLVVEAVKEREEWEIINHPKFGLLHEVVPRQRINTRKGTPTPDDIDELLTLVWKKPAFFLAHPKAIAAFGREATRRGVPPATVSIFGSQFVTWRGIPFIPTDKLAISPEGQTSILLLRVGEAQQGVIGLQKIGVTGEVEPGLSVRYMGTNENSIASHLVTRYFSTTVLTDDAIGRLDNVSAVSASPAQDSIPRLTVFDVEAIRRDFPVLNQNINGNRIIWLDNAATTQKPNSVINSISDFYRPDNSNIHRAAHTLARRSTDWRANFLAGIGCFNQTSETPCSRQRLRTWRYRMKYEDRALLSG